MLESKYWLLNWGLFQNTMYPLDPGYSEWLGFLLKMISKAQLQLLKLNYQVRRLYRKDKTLDWYHLVDNLFLLWNHNASMLLVRLVLPISPGQYPLHSQSLYVICYQINKWCNVFDNDNIFRRKRSTRTYLPRNPKQCGKQWRKLRCANISHQWFSDNWPWQL